MQTPAIPTTASPTIITAPQPLDWSQWPQRATRIYVEIGDASTPRLVRWSSWIVRNVPGGYESYAVLTGDGPVLIDPRDPAPDVAEQLWSLLGKAPIATLLTNDWHERDAYVLRDRFATPVWAPVAGLRDRGGELDGTPDYTFADGDVLPGGLRAFKVPGGFPGDTLLKLKNTEGRDVIFTGDVLQGQTNPDNPQNVTHWRREEGLYLYAAPIGFKRVPNLDALKARLLKLRDESFDLLCGAHSRPVNTNAQTLLAALLDLDWDAFAALGKNPAVLAKS